MKTYKQPPPWPNDPQQWDTRHDIRRFLEDAMEHANRLSVALEELAVLNVVGDAEMDHIDHLYADLYSIYNGEEEV